MSDISGGEPGEAGWYDLFSRGARDWLRHNDKVRDAVRQHLPQIVAGADVLNGGATTVRVPVRMLEHYRFRLRPPQEQEGVGQGDARPGDKLGEPQDAPGTNTGGNEDGGIQYTVEFRIEDIVDWLWEEMKLPNLESRMGGSRDDDWTREGWDRRGARSRLDRRRSLKESIKRRGMQGGMKATVRRSRTTICASGSSPSASSQRCRRSCSCCSMSPAAWANASGWWPRPSFSGPSRACAVSTGISTSCSWPTRPRRGNSRKKNSSASLVPAAPWRRRA